MTVKINSNEVMEHVHTCDDCQNEYRHPPDQNANCEICPLCAKARRWQEGKFDNAGIVK